MLSVLETSQLADRNSASERTTSGRLQRRARIARPDYKKLLDVEDLDASSLCRAVRRGHYDARGHANE